MRGSSYGFTILELIIVIVILGIVAGMATPLFNQALTQSKLDAAAQEVATAINYARTRSLMLRQEMRVNFDVGRDEFKVQEYAFEKLKDLQDVNKSTLRGSDVEEKMRWEDIPHPVNDVGREKRDWETYKITFSTQLYKGVDLLSAVFGSSSTVTFSASGTPDSGGTVTLQLGGLQKLVTINSSSGIATVN